MQTSNDKPFSDSKMEEEYQNFKEGVRVGDIFNANVSYAPDESDDSGQLIMVEVLEELKADAPLSENVRTLLMFAIRAILEGEDARKAFGLNSPPGRKASGELAREVQLYVDEQISTGMAKSKAIQGAAEHFHKDPRHIQRLLAKK
jgi:hypothetical protein